MSTLAPPPLAPSDYLVPSERLPRARAAAWMRYSLIVTSLLTVLVAVTVCLMPMATTITLSGEILPPGGSSETLIRLRATEDHIGEFSPGQFVSFRTRSNADRLASHASARVVRITPESGRSSPGEQAEGAQPSYLLDAEIAPTAQPLPPGTAVDAEIVIANQLFYHRWLHKPAPTR
jgi:hypothetical protein